MLIQILVCPFCSLRLQDSNPCFGQGAIVAAWKLPCCACCLTCSSSISSVCAGVCVCVSCLVQKLGAGNMPPKRTVFPKGHCNDLADAFANHKMCRQRILDTKTLLCWPSAKQTGCITQKSLRLNADVMLVVGSILCPQSSGQLSLPVAPVKKQAAVGGSACVQWTCWVSSRSFREKRLSERFCEGQKASGRFAYGAGSSKCPLRGSCDQAVCQLDQQAAVCIKHET